MTIRIPVRSEPHGDIEIDPDFARRNGWVVGLLSRCGVVDVRQADVPVDPDPMPIVRVNVIVAVGRVRCPVETPASVFAEIIEGAEYMPRLVEWWPPRSRRGIVEHMRKRHLEAEAHRDAGDEHRMKAAEIVNIFHKDAELERAAARGREADEISRNMGHRMDGLITAGVIESRWADKWHAYYRWSWAEMVEREPEPGVMY